MHLEQHRSPLTITTVPRSTIAQTNHKEIDAILKDLRLCSRRLKSALDSFTDELQVLERLYYKCKNQHRMALFFKRVSEMRRYARRLTELAILEHVDLFRASFVGLEHTNDQKALRGSWSRVPEKQHIHFLSERLTACAALVSKMRERLENAYHHFSLAIQTGAFAQLIVLFIAIASRMSMLSSELHDALQLCNSTCSRLLFTIHPTGTNTTTFKKLLLQPDIPSASYIDHDVLSEDIGRPVSRCEATNVSIPIDKDIKWEVVITPSSHPINTGDHTTVQPPKETIAKVASKSRHKKTKKKLDEIDEIFGF